MNKASNKLAAGMRKVRDQESKPNTAEAGERKAGVPGTPRISRPKPATKPMLEHPECVWPD